MYTIRYSSTRSEVWRWYWRSWARRGGLWRHHALLSLSVAALLTASVGLRTFIFVRFVATAAVTMLACIALFPLWPQIRFKPMTRELTIDAEGWKTTIGKLSGARPWKEVRAIEATEGTIAIVGVNGNALILPGRAFPTEKERQAFLAGARSWHVSSGSTSGS
jgi:hypothetical protein